MHTGLLTNGFYRVGQTDFRWVAEWAASHGFKEIEIGDSVELDEALFERIQGEGKIRLGSFCYCKNMLHPLKGKYYTKELLKRIDLAHRLDMDKVIVFTGFDLTPDDEEKNFGGHLPVEKQVDVVAKAYHPIVDYAEKRGVKIAFENCPMMGNIAYSPLIYDQIFEKLDSKNVGFAFDPAHFVWLMNDPYREIIRYGDKIFHVHGKDCEIDRQRLAYTGIYIREGGNRLSDRKGNFGERDPDRGNGERAWFRKRKFFIWRFWERGMYMRRNLSAG